MSKSIVQKGRVLSPFVLSLIVCVFAVGVVTALYLSSTGSASGHVMAAAPQPSPNGQKRYKATKKIVVDDRSGEARMPTEAEVDKLVSDLRELTKRDENLPEKTIGDQGMATIDLEGGFGGTFISRPNADGTMETKCVFGFEEAAEFMGLVEETL